MTRRKRTDGPPGWPPPDSPPPTNVDQDAGPGLFSYRWTNRRAAGRRRVRAMSALIAHWGRRARLCPSKRRNPPWGYHRTRHPDCAAYTATERPTEERR